MHEKGEYIVQLSKVLRHEKDEYIMHLSKGLRHDGILSFGRKMGVRASLAAGRA